MSVDLSSAPSRELPPRELSSSRLLTAVVAQAMIGVVFAWSCVRVLPAADEPQLSLALESRMLYLRTWYAERVSLDAAFLVGVSAGLLLVGQITAVHRLVAIWAAAFVAAALGTAVDTMLTLDGTAAILLRLAVGAAAAVAWTAAGVSLRRSVPNFARWRTSGYLAAAFALFGIFPALVIALAGYQGLTQADSQLAAIWLLPAGLAAPAILISFRRPSLATAGRVGGTFSGFGDHNADSALPGGQTAECALTDCSAEGCGVMHDDAGGAGCEAEECCGGAAAVKPTPVWIGVVLAGCGFVLMMGPLLTIWQSALLQSAAGRTWPIWLIGAAGPVGVLAYRVIMGQVGNTLALPMSLLTVVCAVQAISIAEDGSVFWSLLAFLSVMSCSAGFYGCLSVVHDYFSDGIVGTAGTTCLSMGAAAAAAMLTVVAVQPAMSASTVMLGLFPLLVLVAAIAALRAVPQPIIVTRFAERFLNRTASH